MNFMESVLTSRNASLGDLVALRIDNEVLAHIWPSHHENVHFYGTHNVDIAAELTTLDTNGYRPLRTPHASRPR